MELFERSTLLLQMRMALRLPVKMTVINKIGGEFLLSKGASSILLDHMFSVI